MLKALTEMNVQLANVISDIGGLTGMTILRAIVKGERNPGRLADLKHNRIRASSQEIAQSLEGNWREEQLFVLEQSLALYDLYYQKISECDHRIESHLRTMESKVSEPTAELVSRRRHKKSSGFDLRAQLIRIAGVDLTRLGGVDVGTVQTVISEVGVDMSRWKTEKQFASWLGLCPDHRISGGTILKRGTRHVVNRAATALRMSAWSLMRSQSALGANFRRLRRKLGAPKAITAMAHKLARLVYRRLKFGDEYVDRGASYYEDKFRSHQLKWLTKQAASLNLQLTPAMEASN